MGILQITGENTTIACVALGPIFAIAWPARVAFNGRLVAWQSPVKMMAACAVFEDSQRLGYCKYKAQLRQEINNDWLLIDHDIWVSLSYFAFSHSFLFSVIGIVL